MTFKFSAFDFSMFDPVLNPPVIIQPKGRGLRMEKVKVRDFFGREFEAGQRVAYCVGGDNSKLLVGIIEQIKPRIGWSDGSVVITIILPEENTFRRVGVHKYNKILILDDIEEGARGHESFFILKDLQKEIKAGNIGNKKLKKVMKKYESIKNLGEV